MRKKTRRVILVIAIVVCAAMAGAVISSLARESLGRVWTGIATGRKDFPGPMSSRYRNVPLPVKYACFRWQRGARWVLSGSFARDELSAVLEGGNWQRESTKCALYEVQQNCQSMKIESSTFIPRSDEECQSYRCDNDFLLYWPSTKQFVITAMVEWNKADTRD